MLRPFLTNLLSLSPPELGDLGGLIQVVFLRETSLLVDCPVG